MFGGFYGLQPQSCDVIQVCAPGFLVNGALIQLRILRFSREYSVNVNHWQQCVQHFIDGLVQSAVPFVPSSAIQIQPINVNTFL